MSYSDTVATAALLAAFLSLGWQIYTWLHQKKREETPILRMIIKKKEIKLWESVPAPFRFNIVHKTFYIQNIGSCSVEILNCSIDSVPVGLYSNIKEPNVIIGAKIGPGNSVSSPIEKLYGVPNNLQGKLAKIKCKLASGNIFEAEYTLSEEWE